MVRCPVGLMGYRSRAVWEGDQRGVGGPSDVHNALRQGIPSGWFPERVFEDEQPRTLAQIYPENAGNHPWITGAPD